jgi:hypothetical protein
MKLHILKFLFFALLFLGCERVQSSSQNIDAQDQSKNVTQSTSQDDSVTTTKNQYDEIKINIYIENSISMAGYIKGTQFKKDLVDLLTNLLLGYEDQNIKVHFIGSDKKGLSKINSVKKSTSVFLNNIQTIGTSQFVNESSAFGNILKNIVKKSNDSTVSILLTDNIISSVDSDGNTDPSGVEYQKGQIKKELGDVLNKDPVFTYFLAKSTSDFDGTYYFK